MLNDRAAFSKRLENVSRPRVRLETLEAARETAREARAGMVAPVPQPAPPPPQIPAVLDSTDEPVQAEAPAAPKPVNEPLVKAEPQSEPQSEPQPEPDTNRAADAGPQTASKSADVKPPAEPVKPDVPEPSAPPREEQPAKDELPHGERRDPDQNRNRAMGYVISCSGSQVVIRAVADHVTEDENTQWAIGRLISINLGKSRIVGLIYQLDSADQSWHADGENNIVVRAELQGEVIDGNDPANPVFRRGISSYPHVGAITHRIRVNDLKAIYRNKNSESAVIGTLSQDASVLATISVEEMISKHFAILGSTGSGKSSASSLVLHKIQEAMPELRILILDPHNEYSRGFRDTAETLDINSFELPHWLFQLEEFCEVLFRGSPVSPEERDAMRDLIPAAKLLYLQHQEGVSIRKTARMANVTADSPVPYRISDLTAVIDEQIGQLESPIDRSVLKSLKGRIDSLSNDPRFRFMFSTLMVTDNAAETLGKIFRIPANGKPVCVLHMADIPSEVVSSLVSVICRLAFDLTLSSNGRLKVLIVCEEAHRYIPEDKSLGFAPTRQAIARIAKEGRKYGIYLCIITQRPGELDPTILSQCSTVFALRLSNEADQDIVRGAIPSSSASTISFLSSIGNREAIAFGEGISTPMRLRFSQLPDEWILGHMDEQDDSDPNANHELEMIAVLRDWRNN